MVIIILNYIRILDVFSSSATPSPRADTLPSQKQVPLHSHAVVNQFAGHLFKWTFSLGSEINFTSIGSARLCADIASLFVGGLRGVGRGRISEIISTKFKEWKSDFFFPVFEFSEWI